MDSIGPFTFLRLSSAPPRVDQQWEIAAWPAISGQALWSLGARGEPFTLTSEAVALTYAYGRDFLAAYKTLELADPVTVSVGTQEPTQLYKVLRVQHAGPGVKAVVRAHVANDPTWYQALVFAEWTLLPIETT